MTINVDSAVFDPQTVSANSVETVRGRHENKGDGVRTGIATVDKVLEPLRPGELVTVLGFTSNYKTGLMNYIARNEAARLRDAGIQNRAVVTFTWEQSIEEQGIIDIAQLSGLSVTRMMRGDLDEGEWQVMERGAVDRAILPWWLVGHSGGISSRRPRMTMTDAAHAMNYIADVQQVQPSLIVLDYLQRVRREGDKTREAFMDIVDRAKDMALAFHCPVIIGSQAKRDVNDRSWCLPQVDDGQETSNLEQSSDKFLSVWMPKNNFGPNELIEFGGQSWSVTPNLLILGVLKQKFGSAPHVIPLHVRPEVNEIYPTERVRL